MIRPGCRREREAARPRSLVARTAPGPAERRRRRRLPRQGVTCGSKWRSWPGGECVGGLVGGLAGGRSSPGDGARHGIRTPRLCRPPPSTPCRPCCAQARRTLCQLRAGGGRRACRRRQRARGRHCCPQPRHVVHHRGAGECTGGGAAEARAPDHVRRRGGGRAGAGRRRGALGAQPGREARAQVGGRAGRQAGPVAGAVAGAPRRNIIPPWSHAAQRSSCSCSSARSVGRLAMSSARLAARPAGRGTACFRSLTWRCAWWWST